MAEPHDTPGTPTRYTTWGSVRGACGHLHRTVALAERCRARDMRRCRRRAAGSSYSDRAVFAVEGGRRRHLTDDEQELRRLARGD